MPELDVARIKRNISKMIDQGAPESDIDAYVASEGTTPDALRAAKAPPTLQQFGPEQPPAPPTSELPIQPFPDMPLTRAGVQGAGRGLADLAGMGPDLVNAPLNVLLAGSDWASQKLGGPEVPFRFKPVSEDLANTASELARMAGFTVLDPEKMTGKQRLAYNINRFGTQAALTAPALATAAIPRAAAIKAGQVAPRFGDSLLRPYMGENIAPTLAGDAAAGVGAGGAMTAVERSPLKDWPLAEAAAPIAGGLGGVAMLGLAKGLAGGVASLANRPFGAHLDKSIPADSTGMRTRSRASDTAAREVQHRMALTPEEASDFLTRNRDMLRGYMPDTMPTALQMTEDPGLAQLDKKLAVLGEGPELLRQQKFQSGVRNVIDKIVPSGAAAEDLIARAQTEADARMAAAEGRQATAEGRAARVAGIRREQGAGVAERSGTGVPASEALHEAVVERSYVPERQYKNEMFRAIDPDRSIMVDTLPLADAAILVRKSLNKLGPQREQLPAEFVNKFEDLFPQGDELSVQAPASDIIDLRMYLSKAQDEAQYRGNFKLSDNIALLKQAISETIKDVPGAAEANQAYGQFADVFRPNRTDEMAKFTREIDREFYPPPSQTAPRFLQPNRPERSAALGRVLQATEDPEAAQSVKNYLLADLAESGAVDTKDMVKPGVVTRWAQKHAANINLVPGFRAEVERLIEQAQKGERVTSTVAKRLKAAQTGVKRTQAEIDKGALGLVLGADVDKAIRAVMDHPNRSRRLLNELIDLTANDERARNGLKAAVHQYIVDKATTTATEKMRPGDTRGPVSSARLSNIFGEHEQELARIFTPEEMNGLRAGYEALRIANVERLRAGTGSDTAEKLKSFDQLMASPLGRGIDAALRLKYGMLKGGGLMAVARRQFGGKTDTVLEEAGRLIKRTRQDPEILLTLIGRKLPVGSPAWNARLNALMGAAAGARSVNENANGPLKP